jgi:hypothetical protein
MKSDFKPSTMTGTLKNLLFITLILYLIPLSLSGQEVDHVYLKTGSVIRGKILEIEPAGQVRIQDLSGNTWSYPMDQVEKITSETYRQERLNHTVPGFEPGYVNMTSMGFLAGSPVNEQVAPFSLVMVNGWRNSLGIFTGAGAGIEFLSTSYVPLFMDLRYDLTGGDVVPYLVARGGYALPLRADYTEYDTHYAYNGGPLAAAGMGLKIKTRDHFAWDVTLMYRYQRTSYSEIYDWNHQEYAYTEIYNRIEIRLGFYID